MGLIEMFIEGAKYFWKVTLGPDYPEGQVEIENSTDPEMKELRESLNRVKLLEQKQNQFEIATTSPRGGKGRGNSNQVVETVEINQKVVREAMQNTTKREAEIEDRDI